MGVLEKIAALPRLCMAGLIAFYQVALSPLKPRCCRFVPSCSEYGRQAFLRHGFIKGFGLTLWRILRCHPFYKGAVYDPVPELSVRSDSRKGERPEA